MTDPAPCPACGARRCRPAYERLLARIYGSATLLPLRQLAVDAYAVQAHRDVVRAWLDHSPGAKPMLRASVHRR